MRFGITIIAFLFTGTMLSAQTINKGNSKVSKTNENNVKTVDDSKYKAKLNGVVFHSKESAVNSNEENKVGLLQEIYLIEDERVRVERDNSLSTSEKTNILAKNSNDYQAKKLEFKSYIVSRGVLNVSSKEQRYYISLLKNDNETEEIKRVVELIKTSK